MIFRAGLLATVFLAGAALMSLEMVSFRVVQPDLGSDIIVTGSLISVFLGGLALGAFLGGILADRKPCLLVLGVILMVAGAGRSPCHGSPTRSSGGSRRPPRLCRRSGDCRRTPAAATTRGRTCAWRP